MEILIVCFLNKFLLNVLLVCGNVMVFFSKLERIFVFVVVWKINLKILMLGMIFGLLCNCICVIVILKMFEIIVIV